MAYRNRRSARRLEDLPGLFDNLEPVATDPYLEIIDEHRKKQSSKPSDNDLISMPEIKKRRELQFISFGSGSSGNCSYIGIADEGGILVDAGIDDTRVIDELRKNCIPLDSIKGIILTHDHSDHVRYAYKLLRRIPKICINCTPRTLTGILRRHNISKRIKDFHKPIFKEFAFELGPFIITPFEVSHDGTDNVGFFINAGSRSFVVATDMGTITDRADYYIRQANFLMIEANYDARMLATGRYPEYLKARIRSDYGHLNNETTATYLAEIWEEKLSDIYLCHLSQDNNRPEIALHAVESALKAKGITIADGTCSIDSRSGQVRLSALPRFEASPLHLLRL